MKHCSLVAGCDLTTLLCRFSIMNAASLGLIPVRAFLTNGSLILLRDGLIEKIARLIRHGRLVASKSCPLNMTHCSTTMLFVTFYTRICGGCRNDSRWENSYRAPPPSPLPGMRSPKPLRSQLCISVSGSAEAVQEETSSLCKDA